jgi:hypothetical protein
MDRRHRTVKLVVPVIVTAGALAGLSFAGAGTGLAAASNRQAHTAASASTAAVTPDYSATVTVQNVDGREAPVYDPSGEFGTSLRPGTQVVVTCYYLGNPPAPYVGDGYQDHIDLIIGIGYWVGHIPDRYVNLGGRTPPQYGVPEC